MLKRRTANLVAAAAALFGLSQPAFANLQEDFSEANVLDVSTVDIAPDADGDNISLHLNTDVEPVPVSEEFAPAEDVVLEPSDPDAIARGDLWDRIRKGFKLNHDHKRVAGELAWYRRNQEYLNRVVDRAEPFLHLIVEEVEKRNMPMEIALLPVIESAFQPFAYSHGRASGIWQFIPGTGRLYGLKQNWWYDGRRDVVASTRAALDYFEALAARFHGDWELALASYNTGEGNVERAVTRNKKAKKRTDFWSLKLPAETRGYVPRLHAVAAIVDDPARFGITLRSLPDRPQLAKANIGGQIDMAFAANLADLSVEELYRLNPAINRWATDPEGPHYLLVPLDNAEVFEQRLAQFPADQRTRWVARTVGAGETLAAIAKAYGTSTDVLERVNKVKASKVHAGRELVIPVSMHDLDQVPATALMSMPVAQPTPVEDKNEPTGEKVAYRVKRGDTLSAIARLHRVGAKDIARWNHMKISDPLMPGQMLALWSNETREPDIVIEPEVTTPLATPPREDIMRQVNYVVRRGDTLTRIAERFKVSDSQIRSWNRLATDRRLRPGQRITLHVDVTMQ